MKWTRTVLAILSGIAVQVMITALILFARNKQFAVKEKPKWIMKNAHVIQCYNVVMETPIQLIQNALVIQR
jgi:uncharacterized membrane protein required for colicin V production